MAIESDFVTFFHNNRCNRNNFRIMLLPSMAGRNHQNDNTQSNLPTNHEFALRIGKADSGIVGVHNLPRDG